MTFLPFGSRWFVAGVILALSTAGVSQSPPPPDKGSVSSDGKFVPAAPAPPQTKERPKSREDAEAELLKSLKIERVDSTQVRVGLAVINTANRSVRFPATVNATQGLVEYAVVSELGKRHESLFTTKTSLRDIHLGMLLLGVKSAPPQPDSAGKLTIPEAAAVTISVEWETNGPKKKFPLSSLIALTEDHPGNTPQRTLQNGQWLYNGSGFDAGGFRATREGSVISLIGDDAALINNPSKGRTNDELHVPNTALLPTVGMPVSIIVTSLAKPPLKPAADIIRPQPSTSPTQSKSATP